MAAPAPVHDKEDGDAVNRAWQQRTVRGAAVLLVFVTFVAVWRVSIVVLRIPSFMLPAPETVAHDLMENVWSGLFLKHGWVTTYEVLVGFVIGVLLGVALGYLLSLSRFLEDVFYPYVIAMQAVPKIAVSPLLVLWFGFGPNAKILGAVLLVFFPVMVNTLVGVQSVDRNARDLFTSLNASRWHVFAKLELPSATPVILASLKVAITVALIGAVVVEFVGANEGLGFLVMNASNTGNAPLLFSSLIVLTVLGLGMYYAIIRLELVLLKWHPSAGTRSM
jgi:NitT/TauT family transport system permease protein